MSVVLNITAVATNGDAISNLGRRARGATIILQLNSVGVGTGDVPTVLASVIEDPGRSTGKIAHLIEQGRCT